MYPVAFDGMTLMISILRQTIRSIRKQPLNLPGQVVVGMIDPYPAPWARNAPFCDYQSSRFRIHYLMA